MSNTGNYFNASQQDVPGYPPPTTYGSPADGGPPMGYDPRLGYGHQPGYHSSAPRKGSGLAITALVLGIVALLLCLVPIINNFAAVLALLGFVFGVVGWRGASRGVRSGKGMAVAGVVLSVVAMVGVIGSQIVYGAMLDKASESLEQAGKDIDAATGDDTAVVLERSVDVELGKFRATKDEFGLVTTKMPIAATNKDAAAKSFDIQVVGLAANGDQIAVDHFYVENLQPGQRKMGKVFELVQDAEARALTKATFKVQQVSAY